MSAYARPSTALVCSLAGALSVEVEPVDVEVLVEVESESEESELLSDLSLPTLMTLRSSPVP
jgi:hypothetical protein